MAVFLFSADVFSTSLALATNALLELTPDNAGEFTYVVNPTRESVAALRASGKKPLVESFEFADEAPAMTNWAENACAVAFVQPPRAHLLHTWKLLGVKILKTVRFEPEGSADHFRREASFLAYQGGADGLWLPNAENLPESWERALDEAREDWRIMVYLKNLADKAAANENSLVWIEARRINYWFGWMPAAWENCDTLRLECVAYAKRLEQLLGMPESNLEVKRPDAIEPQELEFIPYSDWPERPVQKQMMKLGDTVTFDGGLSFTGGKSGFSITFSHTNGPSLKPWSMPGGTLDFRLYIQGEKPGTFLPYRYHCDMDPQWRGTRAPATGREGSLFGIDERFRPFSIAYGVGNPRVWVWPRLRDYTPFYPNPRPSFSVQGNKEGGWRATLTFSWLSFYGHWPMMGDGKSDIWFVGLEKDPFTGGPVAGRILWPRGSNNNFRKFAETMTTAEMTGLYKEELDRTRTMWTTAGAESGYPFAKTERPTFQRYDKEGDSMFFNRLVQPIVDANDNAWQLIWTDKEHKNPKFNQQSDRVKMLIWQHLGRMLYMSYNVGLLRRDYLERRYAGDEPPEPVKKVDLSRVKAPDEPDVDFDDGAIQLDDKEF